MSAPCKAVYSAMMDALAEVMETRTRGGYTVAEGDWMNRLEESLTGFRQELYEDWREAIQ